MEQDRTESFESPLDEVMEDIPQEDPPEDLERRCLDALGEPAAEKPAHPRWWASPSGLIAVAAGLVLMIGGASMMGRDTLPVREHAQYVDDGMHDSAPPPADDVVATRQEEIEYLATDRITTSAEGAYVDRPLSDEMERPRGPAGPRGPAAPIVAGAVDLEERDAQIAPRGDAADVIAAARRPPDARPPTVEVEEPWRDFSGDRRVITTKELDLEVGNVEEAYDAARAIVQKHGGFVAGDRVQISEDDTDTAHLTIRLPVEHFESAISDLRRLGKVTRLVGESVDVTQQYYQHGAAIREKADREQRLVEQIEAETNAQRKRQLQAQLDQLRREMEQEKAILGRLAEQTHWPVLELTLTEASGPGEFFSRTLSNSLSVLAWVGATAIIWVPIVVLLAIFWRRLTAPVSPAE